MKRHGRDNDLIERLRRRDLSLADQSDPLMTHLLSLSLEADVVAPFRAVRGAEPTTRRLPLLAGISTAVAGVGLVLSAVLVLPSGTPTPAPTSTTSADSLAVTTLLARVTSDLDKVDKVPAAAKPPLLAQAAATLKKAKARAAALPSNAERRQLNASAAQVQQRLETTQRGHAEAAAMPTSSRNPLPRPSSDRHSGGDRSGGQFTGTRPSPGATPSPTPPSSGSRPAGDGSDSGPDQHPPSQP